MKSSLADSRVDCVKTSDVSETDSLSLRMETESVSETSEVFKQLTRISAQEDFINFVAVKV
jgi:hypothetical protein